MSSAPFEVQDALGLCGLRRRSADLDGSIPLRAARACVPLLEGNAFGWILELRAPLVLRRRRSSWWLDDEATVRRARASVPYLLAEGWLSPGAWALALARGPVTELDGRICIWTGLLVRVAAGRVLRIQHAGNRRNRDLAIGEAVVLGGESWVPLVLEVQPQRGLDRIELSGELATLAAIDPSLPRRIVALAEAPEIGAAHLAFYDAEYFAEKREGPTKKYRRLLATPPVDTGRDAATFVECGPPSVRLEPCPREHTAIGPCVGTSLLRFVFTNAIAFEARYDGLRVHIEADQPGLARAAAAIQAQWTAALGPIDAHKGALWYLSKYFTPHVPGEPHFFVKPWALCASPPGVSLLVDGIAGPGYDVLRGVIRSDRFGAAPAVFALWGSDATIEVPSGRPLTTMLPFVHDEDLRAPTWHEPLPTAARGL